MNIKDSPDIFKIYLVKVDMRLLRHFADYILENDEDEYASLSLNIKMALKIALVVCYSRPFFENYGTEISGGTSIAEYLTNDFLDEEKIIHKNILGMHTKELGKTKVSMRDIENIDSNVVHISLSKGDSKPLGFGIVLCLRKMAKKIYAAAENLVEGTPEFDHEFCFRGVDLQR